MFIDRLIDSILAKNNPTVAGLDPDISYLPPFLLSEAYEAFGQTQHAVGAAIERFNVAVIDAICDVVPAVKPQLAYYEQYGLPGIAAFQKTVHYAKSKGLLVIADGKRNDIGSTSAAYARAYLGESQLPDAVLPGFSCDALTVNGYLGTDGISPFLEQCKAREKGIFVLVKTSNPSSGELQDLRFADGLTVADKMASLVHTWGRELIGRHGYSSVCAVVGATYPEEAKSLRARMPQTYFLIPGYGAQGGSAKDAVASFDKQGLGGIVNASRSILCAYRSSTHQKDFSEREFAAAARAEALSMRDQLNEAKG